MNARADLLSDSFWSIADSAIQQLLAFAIFAILARWLTPNAFGLLAIAHLFVQFVRLSMLDALAVPVQRSGSLDSRLYDWLFTNCLLVAVFFAALLAFAARPLTVYFGTPELEEVLYGMSLVIVLYGGGRAHDAWLLQHRQFRLLALRSLFAVTCGGAVAIWLAARGIGAMALVAQQLVTTLLTGTLALVSQWREWRPSLHLSQHLWRSFAPESLHIASTAVLNYANGNGDTALVSFAFGPHAGGLYSFAKRVTSAVSLMIGAAIGRVGFVRFCRDSLYIAKLNRHYRQIAGLTLAGTLPIFTAFALWPEEIVVVVFGQQWREAAPLLRILGISSPFLVLFNLGQSLSMATGHSSRALKLNAAQLLLALMLALWFIKDGAVEMAQGIALATVVGSCLMQARIARQIQLAMLPLLIAAAPALIGTLFLAAATLIARPVVPVGNWSGLVVLATVGSLAYLTGFSLTKLFCLPRTPP